MPALVVLHQSVFGLFVCTGLLSLHIANVLCIVTSSDLYFSHRAYTLHAVAQILLLSSCVAYLLRAGLPD